MNSLEQAVDSTTQANEASLWIMFTFFVIAPAVIALIAIPLAVAQQRKLKCPKCGNWRHNKAKGMQTVSKIDSGIASVITHQLIVCKKCKNEFGI